jgi:hypothetical protein
LKYLRSLCSCHSFIGIDQPQPLDIKNNDYRYYEYSFSTTLNALCAKDQAFNFDDDPGSNYSAQIALLVTIHLAILFLLFLVNL